MSGAMRMRAHFVGAPFFVGPQAKTLRERFAATGYNTGNLLIGDAAARLLDVDIVSAGTMVDVKALEENVDFLVIPSANFLSPVMDLSWLLPIVEGTTHPIVMVGVGAQFPTTDVADAKLPETTLRLMKIVSERSSLIGVRGHFTAAVLAKHGIHNTNVTGCPSLFRLGKQALQIRKPSGQPQKPLFNGSSNVLGHASSAEAARKVELQLLEMAMAFDAPYVLQNEVPEMLVADGDDSKEAIEGCAATLKRLQADLPLEEYLDYVRRRTKTYFEVDRWRDEVADHDVVLGTRFHGNMIAMSQGIAAVFIAHDSRTTELCEALQIPYVKLEQFVGSTIDQVIGELDFSDFERNYVLARQNLADFFSANGVPHLLDGDTAQAIATSFPPKYGKFADVPVPAPVADGLDAVEQMKICLQQRDITAAIDAYKEVSSNHPKFVGATLLIAEALLGKDPVLAADLANRALARDKANMKAHWLAAKALLASNRADEAAEVARESLRIDPSSEWTNELASIAGMTPGR